MSDYWYIASTRVLCWIMHASKSKRGIRDNWSDMVNAHIVNVLLSFLKINDD
jgi:hypothetical protein